MRNFANTERAAKNNGAVARSIGVSPSIPFDGADADGVADANDGLGGAGTPGGLSEMEQARGFTLNIVPDDVNEDPRTERRPLCGAVLVEAGQFDPHSTTVLIARVSSAGLGSKVEATRKVNERTVEVHVSRENKNDLVQQMKPKGAEDELDTVRKDVEDTCTAKFGKHVDYEVLNTAFRALVPVNEGWTFSASVLPPYLIGDIKDVIMIRAGDWVDAMMIIPLIKEVPDKDEGPIIMDL